MEFRAQLFNDPLLYDYTGIPRPSNIPLMAWQLPTLPPTIFYPDFGLTWINHTINWDIGAYQFQPGAWINVALLWDPLATPPAFTQPTGLDITSIQIQNQLQSLGNSVAHGQLGTNVMNAIYYDSLGTNYAAKAFYDNQGNLRQFYFNGMYGSTNVKIADDLQTPGLGGSNYMWVSVPVNVATGVNIEAPFFQGVTPVTPLYFPYDNKNMTFIPIYLISSDGSKDIRIDYDPQCLKALINSPWQVQSNFCSMVHYMLEGGTNLTAFGGQITGVETQWIYSGSSVQTEQQYLQMLNNISPSLDTKIPALPPSNLQIMTSDNNVLLWKLEDPEIAYGWFPGRR